MRRLTLLTLLALGAIVRPAAAVLIGVPTYANGGADAVLHYAPTGLERYARAGQFMLTTVDPATGETRTVHAYSSAIAYERPSETTVTLGLLSDTVRDAAKLLQMNALLANGDRLVHDDASSAGLQLALWEVVNEAGTTGYDLTTGAFFVTETDAATLAAAAMNLAKLESGRWRPNARAVVRQLTDEDGQSLVFLDVPEPASLSILAAALLLLRCRKRGPLPRPVVHHVPHRHARLRA